MDMKRVRKATDKKGCGATVVILPPLLLQSLVVLVITTINK